MWSTIEPLRVVIAVAIPSNPWACCNEGRSKRTCGSGSKDTIVPRIWAVQTNHKQTTSNNNCQAFGPFASFCHVASLKVAPQSAWNQWIAHPHLHWLSKVPATPWTLGIFREVPASKKSFKTWCLE